MRPDEDLILLDSLQFINNTFLSMPLDEPLPIIYRRFFAGLVGKLKLYGQCSHGLHLMGNVMFDRDKNPMTIETYYLYVGPESDKYLLQPHKIRNNADKNNIDDQLPQYVPFTCENPVEADGWHTRLKRLLTDCPKYFPTARSSAGWVHFLKKNNAQPSKPNHKEIALQDINRSTDKVLVILLSDPTPKLLCGRLGTVILWNTADEKVKKQGEIRLRCIKTAAKHLSLFISQLLWSQYDIQNNTSSNRPGTDNKTRPKFNHIKEDPDLKFTADRPALFVAG